MTKNQIKIFCASKGYHALYSGKRKVWFILQATHTPVSLNKLRKELRANGVRVSEKI